MHDRVDAPMPAAALRSTFVYRHRQLADDLAAHRDAADAGIQPLVVAVTGASGLVGTALTALLTTGGHRVIRLVPASRQGRTTSGGGTRRARAPTCWPASTRSCTWPGRRSPGASPRRTRRPSGTAGSSRPAGWPRRRRSRRTGRVRSSAPRRSAIYGFDRGDALLTEDSARGDGFLADVVADWEAATAPAVEAGLRVVDVRTGIVQAADGGTLRLLRPLFAAGLGGRLGSGRQWLSWIGLDDLLDVYYRALYDDRLVGPVNAVGAEPGAQRRLHQALAAGAAPAGAAPGSVAGTAAAAGGAGRPRTRRGRASGWCRPSCWRWATDSVTRDVADALAHQLGHG